jgi:hypothetical protein
MMARKPKFRPPNRLSNTPLDFLYLLTSEVCQQIQKVSQAPKGRVSFAPQLPANPEEAPALLDINNHIFAARHNRQTAPDGKAGDGPLPNELKYITFLSAA